MSATSALPALLVIDMVKDNFDEGRNLLITPLAREIIGSVNCLTDAFRDRHWPIVFATDALPAESAVSAVQNL